MNIPITNASPLIVLAKIEQLNILSALFDKIIIPEEVYKEAVIDGLARGYPDALALRRFLHQVRWEIRPVDSTKFDEDLRDVQLDRGEKAAIYLASQKPASLLLIDEKHARDFASARGCPVIGTLGILVNAFYKELISFSTLELIIAELMQRDDIWISHTLCQFILDRVKNRS